MSYFRVKPNKKDSISLVFISIVFAGLINIFTLIYGNVVSASRGPLQGFDVKTTLWGYPLRWFEVIVSGTESDPLLENVIITSYGYLILNSVFYVLVLFTVFYVIATIVDNRRRINRSLTEKNIDDKNP
jgi:large-conductance mechanosensitive channel